MEKYEKDGKIAVLVSPGFGAGWSSWNGSHAKQLAMDKRIVEYVLNDEKGNEEKAKKFLQSIGLEGVYCGGYGDIEIHWVEKGIHFQINEYDGSESLQTFEDMSDYLRA